MLCELLEKRQCFKLVCGAGNEDVDEVERLVSIYAKAGVRYFDLSANKDVIKAAYRGLERVVSETEKYYLNISVGIKGDPHVSKSLIDRNKCKKCGKCVLVCPQKAIVGIRDYYGSDKARCIGCNRCFNICKHEAIKMISEQKNLNEVLPPLIREGISSVELHAVGYDDEKIKKQWKGNMGV